MSLMRDSAKGEIGGSAGWRCSLRTSIASPAFGLSAKEDGLGQRVRDGCSENYVKQR